MLTFIESKFPIKKQNIISKKILQKKNGLTPKTDFNNTATQ
jgi:hypothetical protein